MLNWFDYSLVSANDQSTFKNTIFRIHFMKLLTNKNRQEAEEIGDIWDMSDACFFSPFPQPPPTQKEECCTKTWFLGKC